ncbi:hypothetical protein [Sphingomonas panaciterrae]|uniref:hypothetical protein n=1 Tax=Sphingomonas panaciterrae TaxID=1462999 RepID=UPI002FF36F1D
MDRNRKRRCRFDKEMLEGQAEMVGNYHGLQNNAGPRLQARRVDLRRRLKGRGFNAWPIALVATLAACGQQPTRIDVSGTPEAVRFTATAPDGADPACIDRLSVTPVETDGAAPVWQVTAASPARCVTALRYGEPTDAFTPAAPAAPLRVATWYRVRLSGAGFSVVRDFRLTPQGLAVQG